MNGPFNYLWLVVAAIAVAMAFFFWRKAGGRASTGSVPPDQSYPFNAEEILAGVDQPPYTVFEFQVHSGNNPAVDLTSITLTSAEGQNALAGDFAVPASMADSAKISFSNTSQSITIDFTKLPEGKLTVTENSPVTITVLALPRTYSGLSISFTGDPIGRRTLKLSYKDGSPITFEALKRHRINGLSLPDE